MKKLRKWLVFFLIAAIVVAIYVAEIYSQYTQTKEIGFNFVSVFWKNFNTNLVLSIIVFVFIFLIIFLNLAFVRGNLIKYESRIFKKIWPIAVFSLILAFTIANVFGDDLAGKYLMFVNSSWFGKGDPIFNQDIGYYIFQRPFIMALTSGIMNIILFLIWLNLAVYLVVYIRRNGFKIKEILKERKGIIHVIISIVAYFLAKAITFKFQAEELLTKSSSNFVGAGWTDIKVWLNYYRFAPYVLIFVVLLTIYFLTRFKIKSAITTILIYPVFWVAACIISVFVQTVIVLPNEASLSKQYIANNIEFTRQAYSLTNVETLDYQFDNNLTAADIKANSELFENVRVTDYQQNIQTLNQVQNIKNYYQFVNSDIAVYDLFGKTTALFLTARELNLENLDKSAQNYINTKMKYTHGMGVVANPVSSITSEGQPYTVIKDIPSRSIDGAPIIGQPRIYFGETANSYAIVNTKSGEYDDEYGDGYQYTGSAGIQMTFLNRIIYSLKNMDFNMLFSSELQSNSRILLNRNVVARAKMALPFLQIDSDAEIIIDDDGNLVWVLDAYTTSDVYPYAEYIDGINYIRNSVKITVDAYNGNVKAYIIDKDDPLINAYAKMFPTAFESEEFPADLSEHIRYPEYLFMMQAKILSKYHITDPTEFYQKNDMWAVATEKNTDDKVQSVEAYYSLSKVDNEQQLVASLPMTLVNKENLAAWIVVNCDASNYGKITTYKFPTAQNIYGTLQIENKIDTDPEISQKLTLWGQGGSEVVRGNIMVVPIKNSLLYVEPVYLRSGQDAISEVKGVVVAWNDKVVMEATLTKSLEIMFGIKESVKPDENVNLKSAIEEAVESFNIYKNAQISGDWEAAGKAMKDLEEKIVNLNAYGGEL